MVKASEPSSINNGSFTPGCIIRCHHFVIPLRNGLAYISKEQFHFLLPSSRSSLGLYINPAILDFQGREKDRSSQEMKARNGGKESWHPLLPPFHLTFLERKWEDPARCAHHLYDRLYIVRVPHQSPKNLCSTTSGPDHNNVLAIQVDCFVPTGCMKNFALKLVKAWKIRELVRLQQTPSCADEHSCMDDFLLAIYRSVTLCVHFRLPVQLSPVSLDITARPITPQPTPSW